jgi:antitoxin component YwqK of YwqJK toxin-antitoxin module
MFKLSVKKVLLIAALLSFAALFSKRFVFERSTPGLLLIAHDARYGERPLTGVVFARHGNGTLAMIEFFWRGLQVGSEIHWYDNGQRFSETEFRRGRNDGVDRGWFPNGRVQYHRAFRGGLPEGESWTWDERGRVRQYLRFVKGDEIAAKAWNQEGKTIYNYVYRQNEKIGVKGGEFCRPSWKKQSRH